MNYFFLGYSLKIMRFSFSFCFGYFLLNFSHLIDINLNEIFFNHLCTVYSILYNFTYDLFDTH